MVLMIIAILLVGNSWRVRDRAIKAASPKGAAGTLTNDLDGKPSVSAAAVGTARKVVAPTARTAKGRRRTKGLVVGMLGGVALGLFYPVADKGLAGDFGVGPYAGVLLFSLGLLLSTIMYSFYFLNIAIDGEPLSFGAYFRGKGRQHFLAFGGGAMWAFGILAASLGVSAYQQVGLSPALAFILPIASVLLVMWWG